jgi:hypothetical protein
MTDLPIGDGLLGDCLTSVGCFLGIFTYGIGDLFIAWVTSFMMATWRWLLTWRMPYIGGVFCILEQDIKP